jgi:hypothetical protein
MSNRNALQIALEIFRSPIQVRTAQRLPLPGGVLQVIRIASGEALDEKARELTFGWDESDVRAAAVFFLQQILFERDSDPFRLLGLAFDANMDDLKNHKRALLKWLHPDRNANKWESVLLQRVLKANAGVAATVGQAEPNGLQNVSGIVKSPKTFKVQQRSRTHGGIEARRYRKAVNLRAHLQSFVKRMGLLFAAIAISLLLFQVFARRENFQQIVVFFQNTFTWIY